MSGYLSWVRAILIILIVLVALFFLASIATAIYFGYKKYQREIYISLACILGSLLVLILLIVAVILLPSSSGAVGTSSSIPMSQRRLRVETFDGYEIYDPMVKRSAQTYIRTSGSDNEIVAWIAAQGLEYDDLDRKTIRVPAYRMDETLQDKKNEIESEWRTIVSMISAGPRSDRDFEGIYSMRSLLETAVNDYNSLLNQPAPYA